MTERTNLDLSSLPRRRLEKDELLFSEGDTSRELYLLLSGELGVYREAELLATVKSSSSVVGEMSALTGAPRAATIRAHKTSTLIVVEEPDKVFERYPQFGFKLARELATRLKEMNDRYRELRHASRAVPMPAAVPPVAPRPAVRQKGGVASKKPAPPPSEPEKAGMPGDADMEAGLFDALDDLFRGGGV